MTKKVLDGQGRWRSKIIAFRISPEENEQLDKLVRISGMTKQDYLITRTLQRDMVIRRNPKVYKGMKTILEETNKLLKELIKGNEAPDVDTLEIIKIIADAVGAMKETDEKEGE